MHRRIRSCWSLPGSFLYTIYLDGWGPLYHIAMQTCVFCIPFYSTNYAHTVPCKLWCGRTNFPSLFSLQIGFFKCCSDCGVPYFLRLICVREKAFFFSLPFLYIVRCEKYGERTPSIQGAMGNRERNNPVINCEANITRSPTHGIKGVCWHRYHSSAHSHTHTAERGLYACT